MKKIYKILFAIIAIININGCNGNKPNPNNNIIKKEVIVKVKDLNLKDNIDEEETIVTNYDELDNNEKEIEIIEHKLIIEDITFPVVTRKNKIGENSND
jgi:hypothetical protein